MQPKVVFGSTIRERIFFKQTMKITTEYLDSFDRHLIILKSINHYLDTHFSIEKNIVEVLQTSRLRYFDHGK